MNKHFKLMLLVLLTTPVFGQRLAIKENLPLAALRVPNIGLELEVGQKLTLDISAAYNPFQVSETKKWKLWTVQPELRYWFCQNFSGSFVGLHAGAGQFNIGGFDNAIYPGLKDTRVQGSFWNAGISYGYHWILSPRWGIEATAGFGYANYQYKRFNCLHCGEKVGSGKESYLGPTRAGISLIYMIR